MSVEIRRFLVLTFATSWFIWGGLALLTQLNLLKFGSAVSMILFILGGVTPAFCEIWLKKKYSTKEEFHSFVHNIKNAKHPLSWYIFVIGLAFIACFLPTLWGGAVMEEPLYLAFIELPIMIVGGV